MLCFSRALQEKPSGRNDDHDAKMLLHPDVSRGWGRGKGVNFLKAVLLRCVVPSPEIPASPRKLLET